MVTIDQIKKLKGWERTVALRKYHEELEEQRKLARRKHKRVQDIISEKRRKIKNGE